MSATVKDNEILTSIPEARTSAPASPSASGGSSRPQPVASEVAVTINGARTIEGSDKREPFSESTKTVLIFGHGAVVRLASSVAPGQLLFITNDKTKKEVVCQVVKSKNYSSVSGYVELEFTQPVANFWGMRFPSERGAGTSAASTLSAKSVTPPAIVAQPTAISSATLSPAAPVKPAALAAPPFAAISATISQAPAATPVSELLQSSAETQKSKSTLSQQGAHDLVGTSDNAVIANELEERLSALLAESPAKTNKSVPSTSSQNNSRVGDISEPAAKANVNAAKPSMEFNEVKVPSWLEPLARNAAIPAGSAAETVAAEIEPHEEISETEESGVTEVEEVPALDAHQVPAPTFGSELLFEAPEAGTEQSPRSSNKKFMIAAMAAGLALVAGIGYWYAHPSGGNPQSAAASATQASVGYVPQAQTTQRGNGTSQLNPGANLSAVSSSASTPSLQPASSRVPSGNAGVAKASSESVIAPEASAQPKKSKLADVHIAAPAVATAKKIESVVDPELTLDNSSQVSPANMLASNLGASGPARPLTSNATPRPIGGDVKNARLISSVNPVYPAIAKAHHVSGDVKIDALVDATGRVSNMTMISGMPQLQTAAMDALRQWKYEPGQLNGKPVAMHVTVTIQFKLQ